MKTNFISLKQYKLHFKVASKSIDPKFILGFLSGPTMPNSVSDYCSNDYGTLTWAIEKCDNDPNCEFIHDYGCDNASWRYCPNLLADANKNNQGKACSKLKKGKYLIIMETH